MTPIERGVRDFIVEWNRRRWHHEQDHALEASSYWGVVGLLRDSVPAGASATPQEIVAALHSVGYTVQAVSERTYRVV